VTFDRNSPAEAARPDAPQAASQETPAPAPLAPLDLPPASSRRLQLGLLGLLGGAALLVGFAVGLYRPQSPVDPVWSFKPAPLVKPDGDPYLRALMRTISVAESNSTRPYSLLYGGEHFGDLTRHPDQCLPILAGPNIGDCTTAAGRYQFITTTWEEKAAQYHPKAGQWFVNHLSFAPEFQDEVVYRWLSDPQAWEADLSQLLRDGELAKVLEILSPTWTSLGYGIEPNSMTALLPTVYEDLLAEELGQSTEQ
jgi:muramidase (phage lysozyme)